MPYKLNPTQQSDLIREYLDGSLSGERMSEAERLIEHDADARTLSDEGDKLETFVSQLKEALAMPAFPSEKNDDASDEIRQAVSQQLQSSGNADETAAIQLSDPSVATRSEEQSAPSHPLGFLSPPQSADEMGRLNGYRVLKLLGEGGMGLVFEAEDVKLKRRVALKVMKPEIAAKEQHRARFIREAQTAAAVEHDHICPIYQVGEENGVPFIAMPFLKGEPLDVRLKRQKPLPIAEAIRIGRDVAEGLAAAHDAGLVHRDIKPGNVWLEAARGSAAVRVKILDFGLARLTVDDIHLTQSGAIMGTPAYMAPEQARGKQVDHRADLFSLGVILYEMTTGLRPFTGGDTMSILTSLAIDVPTAPNVVNFAVPPALSDLIMQLLAKTPENRPADGRAVSEALMTILMQTSQPIVESLPASNARGAGAAPLAMAVDATAVDPWSAIDESESSPPVAPVSRVAKPATPAKPQAAKGRSRLRVALAALVIFLAGGGFAAYKLAFETKDGTLIVEVDGNDADIRFKNGELQIFGADGKLKYTLKPGERSKTMPPGLYKVAVVSADGVKLSTDKFEMTKDGKVTLRVTADAVVVAKKDRAGPNELPGNSGYALQSDSSAGTRVSIPSLLMPTGPVTIEGYFSRGERAVGHYSAARWNSLVTMTGDSKWGLLLAGDGSSYALRDKADIIEDKVTHVAAVFDDKQARLFVNGRLVGELTLNEANPLKRDKKIGLELMHEFVGTMDEVRVSKSARYDKEFTPAKRFDPDKDTLALYHCDEGQGDVLTDSSGNGHHGKIVGAKWVKADGTPIAPIGTHGYALFLDTNSIVSVPTLRSVPNSDFTMEGFVTLADANSNGVCHVMGFPYRINLFARYGRFAFGGVEDGPLVVAHQRVHIAGVLSKGETLLFVDGVLQKRAPVPSKQRPEPSPGFEIGDKTLFSGRLEELRISKAARYTKDFTPASRFEADKDTLALYHCDEGQGDVLKDSSGNGHHGKIVGAKWVKADGTPIAPIGTHGYALFLDTNSIVSVPTLRSVPNSDFTMEGFVTLADANSNGVCHVMGFPYRINLFARYGRFAFGGVEDGPLVVAHQRVHIAGVLSKGETLLFVDGVLQKRAPVPSKQRPEPSPGFEIGDKTLFSGRLEELRISKAARYTKDFTPASRFEADKDTLALYHCDEGQGDVLKDSSGNGHHGKIVGARWVKADGSPHSAPSVSESKSALAFDGTAWVEVPSLKLKPATSITFELYGVPAAIPSDAQGGTVLGFAYQLSLNQRLVKGKWHWLWGSVRNIEIPFVANRRVKLACVYAPDSVRFYVDGKKVADQKFADMTVPERDSFLAIGNRYFGTLDQVRISKVARYDKDFTPQHRLEPDADTLALYHFDEGQGEVLKDSSGNGHHGKIVRAKWVKADEAFIPALTSSGAALRFDGPSHLVNLPAISLDKAESFTLEGFVQIDKGSHPSNVTVIAVDTRHSINIQKGNFWGFHARDAKTSVVSKTPFDRNRRVHLAGVWDGGKTRLFVDGILQEGQILGADYSVDKTLRALLNLGHFVGTIGEVRISKVARYDKDFTPAQHFEPDADTLALYHCDEGSGDLLKDSSGNGHHGNIVGAKWVKVDVAPVVIPSDKSALEFDGISDYATVPTWNFKGNHALTVEAWAVFKRPLDKDHHEHVISDAEGSGLAITNIKTVNGSFLAWNVYFNDKYHVATSQKAIPRQRLVHFAGVYDLKGEIRFYVDGKLQERTSVKNVGAFKPSTVPFTLGANPSAGPFADFFRGIFHQFRVSKTVRYEEDFDPVRRFEADADTVILFHFSEGQGDKLTDSSGNGHHGKIVGAKWVKVAEAIVPPIGGGSVLAIDKGQRVLLETLKLDISAPFTLEATVTLRSAKKYQVFLNSEYHTALGINSDKWAFAAFAQRDAENKPSSRDASSVQSAVVGKKVHVAGVYSGNQMLVFVDGKLDKTINVKSVLDGINKKLFTIGTTDPSTANDFLIEEIRFSKTARYLKDFTPQKRFETDKDTAALYHCDEGQGDVLKDSSGNGHHGKIVGAKWVKVDGTAIAPTLASGEIGLSFGPRARVSIDSLKLDSSLPFTVEGFVTLGPTKSGQTIFNSAWHVGAGVAGGHWHFTAGRRPIAPEEKQKNLDVFSRQAAVPGKRTHIAGVYTGSQLLLFIDGKLQATVAPKGPLMGMNKSVFDLATADPAAQSDFILSECRFSKVARYDKDFTPAQRHEPDADTLALYHFDEGAGDMLKDSSGNGHHGKIVGAKWVKVDGTAIATFPPLDPAWLKAVAAMPADKQVEAVKAEMLKRNPGFDGKMTPTIDKDGVVTGLAFLTDNATDISPVRALTGLTTLGCFGTPGNGKLADLSPLKGMKLTSLDCFFTRVVDLSPLSAMSLTHLHCGTTGVADLSPLRNMKLAKFLCNNTQVTDLSPLKGMPLTYLAFEGTPVSDLSPLNGMPLTHLRCESTRVTDLSPLKGMKLTDLNCANTQVVDLAPLNEMPLNYLVFSSTPVSDLKALKDMPLTNLHFGATRVADLTPLKGMMLERLRCEASLVSDLSPLKGMPLTWLVCSSTQVSDLSPLKGMPLTWLLCSSTRVSDLSPLKDMKLVNFNCMDAKVTDLSPLQGMPLVILGCDFQRERDSKILRSIKTLETINDKPAEEFWKEVEAKKVSAFPPLDPAWLKAVAAMPAAHQVEAVKAELMKRNPGFDGNVTHEVNKGGAVYRLQFLADNVTDISPVRALTGLQTVSCVGTSARTGKLADLSPLKDMKLTHLDCHMTQVSDLSPLRGMKLADLDCGATNVSDLSPLKGTELKNLYLYTTAVSDLAPLKDMKLTTLVMHNAKVTNLSVLKGMPLSQVSFDVNAVVNAEILRSIKTLETINGKPAAEFWKEVEGKKASAFPPLDPAWLKQVAAMKAEQQVEAVRIELTKRNPGFDSETEFEAPGGVVTTLKFSVDKVTDISPVRALPGLRKLVVTGSGKTLDYFKKNGKLADLAPLKGMKLTELDCYATQVSDLTPLIGMPLTRLHCSWTNVSDLTPLNDMKSLRFLFCPGTKVTDLSPLEGLNLTSVSFAYTEVVDLSPLKNMSLTMLGVGTKVSDLTQLKNMKLASTLTALTIDISAVTDLAPLKGMKLTSLNCFGTQVRDLLPLKDMKLTILDCRKTNVTDLSPLREMPLKELNCDFEAKRDTEIVRSIKTLETINNKPAAEFWKEVDAKKP